MRRSPETKQHALLLDGKWARVLTSEPHPLLWRLRRLLAGLSSPKPRLGSSDAREALRKAAEEGPQHVPSLPTGLRRRRHRRAAPAAAQAADAQRVDRHAGD